MMMTQPTPQSIRRIAHGGIEIVWSDGAIGCYSPRLLRDACPCATCREQRVQPKLGTEDACVRAGDSAQVEGEKGAVLRVRRVRLAHLQD
jgi:DUF971 family protein